ncbi:MAG: porin, partial [Bacteroidaceae bacterium]|nr:porin [Bacteroidaceae bacterium]
MKALFIATAVAMTSIVATAQSQDFDSDNGVVTIGADRMFQIESKDGNFSFKPYLMLQTTANYNYYDDEGLDKAYNQDNVANSGFSIPYAVLGFTGKAYSMVTYNLSVNASKSGGELLQQAWFDVRPTRGFGVKVGKFKTPFSHAYLTTLGETLMPNLPSSLTATTIMPYTLNAVTPKIGTGFDLGAMVHGNIGKWWGYEAGLFNGTGASINTSTKTISDDWHIPSLLYATRVTWSPMGVMPATQGNPKMLNLN